ncbi:unnamed protein product [Caenorhabditis auriculariae]|uniref:Tetratricopeptide repeat protein 39B n=1 Tax=Caenorhabditis auriculariae TaxID=2777116 RepID=A0A8S1HYJ8_9PELO|nr:unnamed protein product [Caenorhabditis auriculariae]
MGEVERPRSLSRITVATNDSDCEYLDAFDHITYNNSLELLDTIAEVQITLNLFMNNKFDLAEERMAELYDKSMYHSLGYTCILFIKSVMTVDKKDMEKASNACKVACTVIEKFRHKKTLSESIFGVSTKDRHLTDEEIHAELCYAEVLLIRAVLSFFHDDNFASFIRGALQVRTCYQTYRFCERLMNESSIWLGRSPKVRDQFESGVRMGLGTFSLMLSTLPSKVLRLLEVVGFSGDKDSGMRDLQRAASMTGTLHSPLCKMSLLTWHLIACFVLGSGQPDLKICQNIIPSLMQMWPKGAVLLFVRARFLLVSGDIDSAIHFFNVSIDSQSVYKQFHHGCYWELLFAHAYLRQWSASANYAKKLVEESKWSRCVYTYLLCIFFAADETVPQEKRDETITALASKVDGLRLRIAGKSIPVEKYCGRKAKRFVTTKSLAFAHYEFLYFWNGFDIVGKSTKLLQPILDDIDRIWDKRRSKSDVDDECLYYFLRAVCLRHLRKNVQAEQYFQKVLDKESQLEAFTYLPPNATFELALIRVSEGAHMEAELLLAKARSYKSYSLENKLHFRIHSAMDTMGVRTPIM